MPQRSRDGENFAASLLIGGSVLFVLFLLFSWGNALLRDAAIEQQLKRFEHENKQMQQNIHTLSQDLAYLKSPQYRDKWAKQHKGLAQPGEKILSIEFSSYTKKKEEDSTEMMKRELFLLRPNREQWRILFFSE